MSNVSTSIFAGLMLATVAVTQAAYKDKENLKPDFEVKTLDQQIDYEYGYDDELVNFVDGYIQKSGVTKNHIVLVNIHTKMELNLTNQFDAAKRTLKWGTPFEYANSNFFKTGNVHQQSALLREWSSGQIRRHVSFVIIPPGKAIEYTIGYAAPQEGVSYGKQTGYGIQLRFKSLPVGTIVMTSSLIQGNQLSKSKENKRFYLQNILIGAIEFYNSGGSKLDKKISDPNSYGYNIVDIEAFNNFHIQ